MAAGVFEIRFPGLGISLKDGDGGAVENWSIDSDFLTPTDAWSVKLVDDRDLPRWYEIQPVELYVEGKKQLIGRVDSTVRGERGSRVITLEGRDYLADLTECNIDPSVSFKAGDALDKAILTLCAPLGITTIVDPYSRNNERTGKPPPRGEKLTAKQLTDNKPDAGMSIFSWCSRAAARYGYTIQPGNSRYELVLQRPTYGGGAIAKLYRKLANKSNNIVDGVARRNWSTIPTHFTSSAQQGTSIEKRTKAFRDWDLNAVVRGFGSEELRTIVWNNTVAGRRLPSDAAQQEQTGQLYRLRHFRDKGSKNKEQLDGSAARMIAGALKETLRYTAVIRGTSDPITGAVWSYDSEVFVDDDLARVNEQLWIASRRFEGSNNAVQTTLECWRPRAYQIDPEGLNA